MVHTSEAVVRFRNVTKRYGKSDDQPALDRVDLSINPGEIFGILGESGSGKSTLVQLINGLLAPTSGSVTVAGTEVPTLRRHQLRQLRRHVGVVFQGIHLLSNRTVWGNVALPLQLAARGPAGELLTQGRATQSRGAQSRGGQSRRTQSRRTQRRGAHDRHAVDEILEFVGLSHRAEHYPAQLSGGEQQRVGLARALVGRPALLLADEPTSSLDTSTTSDVLRVLTSARDELGTTVIVISHDLDVIQAICDRAALIERGALKDVFPVAKGRYSRPLSYREQVAHQLMGTPPEHTPIVTEATS